MKQLRIIGLILMIGLIGLIGSATGITTITNSYTNAEGQTVTSTTILGTNPYLMPAYYGPIMYVPGTDVYFQEVYGSQYSDATGSHYSKVYCPYCILGPELAIYHGSDEVMVRSWTGAWFGPFDVNGLRAA